MKTGVITTDTYLGHDTGHGHPEKADRVTVVIEHLKKHGDPLRWAITAIQASKANNCLKELKVEAVVITSESKSLDT